MKFHSTGREINVLKRKSLRCLSSNCLRMLVSVCVCVWECVWVFLFVCLFTSGTFFWLLNFSGGNWVRILWNDSYDLFCSFAVFVDLWWETLNNVCLSFSLKVVVVFGVCWLPYHVYFLSTYQWPELVNSKSIQHIYLVIYWLAMSNSMLNPIILLLMNKRFASWANKEKWN